MIEACNQPFVRCRVGIVAIADNKNTIAFIYGYMFQRTNARQCNHTTRALQPGDRYNQIIFEIFDLVGRSRVNLKYCIGRLLKHEPLPHRLD
jgi:hypothetical protein